MCRTAFFYRFFLFLLALLTAALPFAAPKACAAALGAALSLCGGPLLLSLFPFLVVSVLFIRSGAGELLGVLLRPAARLVGVRAPCAGGVLLLGLVGGFAPAANAAAQAVRSGQLSAEEAAALLPACICSGPSFVILTVGQGMLGSAGLGARLFVAQALAGILAAALLGRGRRPPGGRAPRPQPVPALPPPRLDAGSADAAGSYLKRCGVILYFRLLAGGLGALLPPRGAAGLAILLEVCSGCDLAARTGRWASDLCCAAVSLQGASVLMQVRAICPAEVSLRPLLLARALHLPLALGLFHLLLPGGAAAASAALPPAPIVLRRVPPDCALLAFLGCCLLLCQLCRALPAQKQK